MKLSHPKFPVREAMSFLRLDYVNKKRLFITLSSLSLLTTSTYPDVPTNI